jgi:transposase InsO family protein
MCKTPEQRILELEQKVKLLEKQKHLLENQLENAEQKSIFFDMMIDIAEKELNIPIRKKSSPRTVDKYRQTENKTISFTCRLVGVTRQVYYRSNWSVKEKQDKATKTIEMVNTVRNIMPRLGTKKLYYILEEELKMLNVGRDKLFDILRANKMLIQPKRSYHITTNSHHRFRKHKDLIQNIEYTRPEQVWVSDITYIVNRNNPQYLSLITDSYSKKIVGYEVSDSLSTSIVIKSLKMAIKNRRHKDQPLIHHSDRGIQYCSDEYQKLLYKNNIIVSMTESYDPYANAIAERVNGILKQEFMIKDYNLSLDYMRLLVKESVEIYNNKRPHYSCYMKTPEQMHKQERTLVRRYKKRTSKTFEGF